MTPPLQQASTGELHMLNMPYKNKEYKYNYQKAYRERNREKLNSSRRKWRKENLEEQKIKEGIYAKNYRKLNPEKLRGYDKKQKARKRNIFKSGLYLLRIAMGGKCSECGFNDEVNILHFHHIKEKRIEVTRCKNIKEAKIEAKKCILLCPNCHAILHFIKKHV